MLTQEASVLQDDRSFADDRSFLRRMTNSTGIDVLVMLRNEASVLRDNPSVADDRSFLRQDDKQYTVVRLPFTSIYNAGPAKM